ncbi:hypothetical protein ANTQUA_LOCUS6595 [Anthophora quadrimaculata]
MFNIGCIYEPFRELLLDGVSVGGSSAGFIRFKCIQTSESVVSLVLRVVKATRITFKRQGSIYDRLVGQSIGGCVNNCGNWKLALNAEPPWLC